jgi:hypothetical protein
MLIRIVVMTFEENKVNDFLTLFEQCAKQIRNQAGCTKLELHKDIHLPNRFYTYSVWNTEQDLENYRNSILFNTVWKQTKAMFKEKPHAYSLILHQEIF